MTSVSGSERVDVTASVQRRRRWSLDEKIRAVEQPSIPGEPLARSHAKVFISDLRHHRGFGASLFNHRKPSLHESVGKITCPPLWNTVCPMRSKARDVEHVLSLDFFMPSSPAGGPEKSV